MKESTRWRDEPIVRLIKLGRYTAKEIAILVNSDGRPRSQFISVHVVYHIATRAKLNFRKGGDRRTEIRPLSRGRRFTDLKPHQKDNHGPNERTH